MESLLYTVGTSSVQGRDGGGVKLRLMEGEAAITNFVLEALCASTGRMATDCFTTWCAACGEPAEVK